MRRAAFAIATCAALVPARGRAQSSSAPIVALGSHSDSAGEIYYAQDLGMYAAAGLNVSLQTANDATAVAGAVLSGNAAIGSITIPGLALAHERGLPLVSIAPGAIYSSAAPTAGIVVLKSAPFKTASDLNGKTLTTLDIHNMGYYGAKTWIDRNGGDSSTIKWFEMPESLALAVPVPPANTRATYAERVRPADAQPVLDVLVQYGALKKPLRAADLFAPELRAG